MRNCLLQRTDIGALQGERKWRLIEYYVTLPRTLLARTIAIPNDVLMVQEIGVIHLIIEGDNLTSFE